MCLGDLLAERSFGLALLSGGEPAAAREVRGAHTVEVEDPGRWLDAGWIMLTTGVRLRGSTEAQRAVVPELEAAGASALGFGVGLGFERVPAALLEVARERAFPVFAVPYETPFREIIRFVDAEVARGEEQLFRRLTALQRYLVDALRAPEPERAMVDRLAGFLDVGVALGELRAGRLPGEDALAEIRAAPLGALAAGGWHAISTAVEPGRRLILAARRPLPRLAKAAAEAATPLLSAMARLTDVVRDQEQAVKAALLEEALAPPPRRDPLPLAARAAAFGLDFTSPARMVVLRGDGDLAAACRQLVAALERAGIPHLAHSRDGEATVLLQGHADATLAALPGDVRVGVGREVATIAEAHHSLRDAELAAGRGPGVTRFEDFDLGTFVVSEVPGDRLEPKVGEILRVLQAHPPLHEAVGAYFAHDLDVAATAEALHMHRNSLRYRLARAEQLMGRSFKAPATIAAVYIALVAERASKPAP